MVEGQHVDTDLISKMVQFWQQSRWISLLNSPLVVHIETWMTQNNSSFRSLAHRTPHDWPQQYYRASSFFSYLKSNTHQNLWVAQWSSGLLVNRKKAQSSIPIWVSEFTCGFQQSTLASSRNSKNMLKKPVTIIQCSKAPKWPQIVSYSMWLILFAVYWCYTVLNIFEKKEEYIQRGTWTSAYNSTSCDFNTLLLPSTVVGERGSLNPWGSILWGP